MTHIMLDLETMGNSPTAAIVAIGACEFDPHGDDVPYEFTSARFSAHVTLESSVRAGLVMDPSTVLWWLKQAEDARRATFEGDTLDLHIALFRFRSFVEMSGADVMMWGNGATFDNIIIRAAFRAVGLEAPWSFRNDKCYRTVVNLLPPERRPKFVRFGTAHDALSDAITQALYLQKVYKALGL